MVSFTRGLYCRLEGMYLCQKKNVIYDNITYDNITYHTYDKIILLLPAS